MVLVAFESSTRTPSVAVLVDGDVLEVDLDGGRAHASDMLPSLSALLDSCDRTSREITAVAVGIGPGSYTGLRVGIATAQGVARAAGAKLLGIPSGEALAHAELSPGETGDLLIDARGGSLYHARFHRTEDSVETLIAPRLVPSEELSDLLDESSIVFLDETLERSAGARDSLRLVIGASPRASSLLKLASQRLEEGRSDALSAVLPLYLRPFEGRVRKR